MRDNSIIRRRISLLLMLIFFQQTGAGLFIHNLLHDKVATAQFPIKAKETNKEISFSCICVDYFLMPFVEADEPVAFQKQIAHKTTIDFYNEQVFYTSLIFSSLRGPPVL